MDHILMEVEEELSSLMKNGSGERSHEKIIKVRSNWK